MYDVQLCIETRRVYHSLAFRVFALEEYLAPAILVFFFGGRGDGHGFAEEVSDVCAEFEESFVGGVFGFLDVFEPLFGFGSEAGYEAFGVGVCF